MFIKSNLVDLIILYLIIENEKNYALQKNLPDDISRNLQSVGISGRDIDNNEISFSSDYQQK